MHQFLKFIYFGIKIYMFLTVLPSIIGSSGLYIQQQVYVKQILLFAASRTLAANNRYCIRNMYSVIPK